MHWSEEKTSCGGTSKVIVLKSTTEYESIHGITKKRPGPVKHLLDNSLNAIL